MPDFTLPLHDLTEEGKDYSFVLSRAWVEGQVADAGLRPDPAAPEGALQLHGQENGKSEYLVHGTISAHLVTDCVRCLGEAKVPVAVTFAALYTRGVAPETSSEIEIDADDEDDNLQREYFTGHEIVLDDLVREYLVLECPMQPLCSPTCAGIPVPAHVKPPEEVFGLSEGGVDPRLAPLMRLRDKVPPNKS